MGTFYCLLIGQEELPVDKAFHSDDTSRGVLWVGYGSEYPRMLIHCEEEAFDLQ